MEMLFTGEFIDADQARDWGLVNRVADDEALDEAVSALTANICAKSAVAVRPARRCSTASSPCRWTRRAPMPVR